MIKRYELTKGTGVDSDDYFDKDGTYMFCVKCLEGFFFGKPIEKITLVLSSRSITDSYKISNYDAFKDVWEVTLSNGSCLRRTMHIAVDNIMRDDFGGTVYLAIEDQA